MDCCAEEGAELGVPPETPGDEASLPCLISKYSNKTKLLIKINIFLWIVDRYSHTVPTEIVIMAVEQPEAYQQLNNG